MLPKNIECLSMSLVAHKGRGVFLFCLLFGVASGPFQPVLACYGIVTTTSKNVLTSKLTLNQLQLDIITKWSKHYYILWQLWLKIRTNAITKKTSFLYYKAEQMILRSRTSITKWDMYYKLGQLLQIRAVQKENERNKGGQQILVTDSLIQAWFASWQTVYS